MILDFVPRVSGPILNSGRWPQSRPSCDVEQLLQPEVF